jgi:hypothetical protein
MWAGMQSGLGWGSVIAMETDAYLARDQRCQKRGATEAAAPGVSGIFGFLMRARDTETALAAFFPVAGDAVAVS